jgi:Pentapeptide repeats (8 copies)
VDAGRGPRGYSGVSREGAAVSPGARACADGLGARADLEYAILTGADLTGVTNADLEGAKGLSEGSP